jgi:site-specific DNA-methyltransferase (adenine-specific)
MKPYYEHAGITIYCGDCRELLPQLSCSWIVTDPPYGFRKAEWDSTFSLEWLASAAVAARDGLAIMPGIKNILAMPREIGRHTYRWTLAVHIINGITRGLMGFGNWIAILIYTREGVKIYAPQQDCTDIAIRSELMPEHPSPKPIDAMLWLIKRLPDGDIVDPFSGSGSILLAAKKQHRHAIGIEIEERYCEVAAKRLGQEVFAFEATA